MKFKMEQEDDHVADRREFREAAPTAGSVGAMLGTKNLLIIIVTMPFVFLVVVMAIIGLVGKPDKTRTAEAPDVVRSIEAANTTQLNEPQTSESQASNSQTSGQQTVLPLPISLDSQDRLTSAIALPEGARPGAISLDGDRLAIRVDTDDGGVIVIYDLVSDRVVKEIPLVNASGMVNP